MPTKKCHLCRVGQQIDELDLTCPKCAEKELDLLMTVYGFIHCYGSDFCPTATIIKDLDPVAGIKPSSDFLKSWIRKGWLDANEINCVRVPSKVANSLQESGYSATASLRQTLDTQKEENRDKHELVLPKTQEVQEEQYKYRRMATIHRRGD